MQRRACHGNDTPRDNWCSPQMNRAEHLVEKSPTCLRGGKGLMGLLGLDFPILSLEIGARASPGECAVTFQEDISPD